MAEPLSGIGEALGLDSNRRLVKARKVANKAIGDRALNQARTAGKSAVVLLLDAFRAWTESDITLTTIWSEVERDITKLNGLDPAEPEQGNLSLLIEIISGHLVHTEEFDHWYDKFMVLP